MFLEGRTSVPAAKALESEDDAGPVLERVSAERARAIRVGVGEHLIREHDRQIVFASQREEVCHLSGDASQRVAFVAVADALEPVEAGRTVEDDQISSFGEFPGIADGLGLFLEIEGVLDDDPRGDGFDVRGVADAGGQQLLEAVGRDAFGVDVDDGAVGDGRLDRGRQREIRLSRGRRPVQLCYGPALEPPSQ